MMPGGDVDERNMEPGSPGAREPGSLGNLGAKPVIQPGNQSRRFIAEPATSVWYDARHNLESWLQKCS